MYEHDHQYPPAPGQSSKKVGMDLHLSGKVALVTGASKGIGLGVRQATGGGRLSPASRGADQSRPRACQGDDPGTAQRVGHHPCCRSQQRRHRAVARRGLRRDRHPGEQCRRHPRRRSAGGRRGALARRLGSQGVRLYQPLPRRLSADEDARRRRLSSTSSAPPANGRPGATSPAAPATPR